MERRDVREREKQAKQHVLALDSLVPIWRLSEMEEGSHEEKKVLTGLEEVCEELREFWRQLINVNGGKEM